MQHFWNTLCWFYHSCFPLKICFCRTTWNIYNVRSICVICRHLYTFKVLMYSTSCCLSQLELLCSRMYNYPSLTGCWTQAAGCLCWGRRERRPCKALKAKDFSVNSFKISVGAYFLTKSLSFCPVYKWKKSALNQLLGESIH